MPNIYIIIICALFFAFCTAVLVYQVIYSAYFRSRIALPHSFSEGMMTGATYPFLWIVYGLIGVQFFSFIVYSQNNDLITTLRMLAFALSIIVFAALKHLTPSLLAYWFGKTALWDGKGLNGKIPYSDIYCVKVHKKKSSIIINNQQIYKVTFYVKDKTFLLLPRKYCCKMVAQNITVLTEYVDFKECKKPKATKKALLYSICAPILLLSVMACVFLLVFAKLNAAMLWSITIILLITLFALKRFSNPANK